MIKIFKLFAFCSSVCFLSVVSVGAQDGSRPQPSQDPISTYRLRPLDVLNIKVFKEPDLDTVYKIGTNGMIVMPLIESVKVAGLTVQDAQKRIKELYEKDYLVNADVSIFIAEYSPQRVYVIGQVNRNGEVIFPPEETMTLSKAIAGAMGPTRLANTRSVNVKRKMADGSIKVFEVDLPAILNDKSVKDFPVYDGDTIEVPEAIF